MTTLLLTLLNVHKKKYQFRRSISNQIRSVQKMANVERWVPSWQWRLFSMGSVNTRNTPDMEKQNLAKNESNILVLNHHLIKNARLLTDKLTAKEMYSILISSLKNKLTSQSYCENSFQSYTFDWKQIYLLTQIITTKSYQHNFQYKILHNILYLNKKLYIFGKIDSPLCSICHSNDDETVTHLLCECVRVSQLWSLRIFFSTDLNIPLLTPKTPWKAIFSFLVETDKCVFKITNHLLLIFKMYIKVEGKVLLILVV